MGSIRRYLKWVKPYKWPIIGTIIIGIIKFAIPLLMPLIFKRILIDSTDLFAVWLTHQRL